jgi:hypothetical protein
MTQEEYYADMASRLATVPPDEILRVVGSRWPTVQVLRRLAKQGSAIPNIGHWLNN